MSPYREIVSDLTSLIGHIRQSLKLIETAIANETGEEAGANVIVLDDVAPSYARADAVLRVCDAGLAIALHLLREPITPGDGALESAGETGLPPRRSIPA